jgi:ABC-type lipoprotein export system ATPase subunit
LSGSSFEIIDGDMLYMPKEFLKTIFKDLDEKVLVLSVIGPQSSGKSTLLNFLFGCDFLTSTGRCTRGIYGTYIKL